MKVRIEMVAKDIPKLQIGEIEKQKGESCLDRKKLTQEKKGLIAKRVNQEDILSIARSEDRAMVSGFGRRKR
jgi:hypothetical protein